MTLQSLTSLLKTKPDLKGKVALLRADLNVPMQHGKVSDATRLLRTIPTIERLQKAGMKVVVMSHFGRPKGKYEASLTLGPIADALGNAMNQPVQFAVDCVGSKAKSSVEKLEAGQVLLLENLRFHSEEEANDFEFAKQLAELGDYYFNDAFSCSHRAHASIEGITNHLPAYAGLLLEEEIVNLQSVLDDSGKPVVAIVGGSKVSTKIELLERLSEKMDYVMIGGGMANTFLYAQGVDVGKSLCEKDHKKTAKRILDAAEKNGCTILLPQDATVAEALEVGVDCRVVPINKIGKKEMMLDIGPKTLHHWNDMLGSCKTVVWNGPVGAFEFSPFDVGSSGLARMIAMLTGEGKVKSVAGGGDTLSALNSAGLRDSLTYTSTAGGAFLEWLEGKELPGVAVLIRDGV